MVASKAICRKSNSDHEQFGKKALRSCVRCRKNKTKCDSMETRPNPCTSCVRRGVVCQLDFVTPPQRSKEMKLLYENIRYASDRISRLCIVYDDFLRRFEVGGVWKDKKTDVNWNDCPTRILKVNDHFFSFNLNPVDESLYVNNFHIKSEFLKRSFKNFREITWGLVKIYSKWERIGSRNEDKAQSFVCQFSVKCLLQKNQLLLLLCLLNFYYDIPGLRYLDIFEYVIESYNFSAFGKSHVKDNHKQWLSKSALSKIIVGDLPDGQFHSELFIKHFTIFLFLNIVLYGPEYFMNCFMDKYIRTLECLRKKINFDKNWEVKWVNFYIRLLNLVESVVPSMQGESYNVDDEEIDFLFSLVHKEREIDGAVNVTLDCFICLVKFDQYLIERRKWPKNREIAKNFRYICERLNSDLMGVFGFKKQDRQEMERFSFMQLLFTQLLTLNDVLCINYCDGSVKKDAFGSSFNGFNYEVYERIPEELVENDNRVVKVHDGYYWCQSKYEFLKKILMRDENISISEIVLFFVEVSVGRHCVKVDEDSNIFDMVSGEFQKFHRKDDMRLRILKSSCRLVWFLYEFVVFWDMLNRVIVYEPFVWNSQLVLEHNGLLSQNGDSRANYYRDSAIDMLHGMDVVDEDDRNRKRKRGSELQVLEGSVRDCYPDVKLIEPCSVNEVNVMGDVTTENVSLNGGINDILQNVDWVKESADEVFEKIHNVLN